MVVSWYFPNHHPHKNHHHGECHSKKHTIWWLCLLELQISQCLLDFYNGKGLYCGNTVFWCLLGEREGSKWTNIAAHWLSAYWFEQLLMHASSVPKHKTCGFWTKKQNYARRRKKNSHIITISTSLIGICFRVLGNLQIMLLLRVASLIFFSPAYELW